MRRLLIWGTFAGFLLALPSAGQAALLYLTPGTGTFQVGDTATLQVRIDNEGECVNAAEVNIGYPKDLVEVVDVGRGDSIFTIWVTPPVVRPEFGLITMIGGIPGGYCGRTPGDPALTNVLARIALRFRSRADLKTPFPVPVTILGSSKVVLNDGLGTAAQVKVKGVDFAVTDTGSPQKNEWAEALRSDKTPPEVFTVEVHRDKSVFDHKYFAVWSTVDKQTGIDRYEVAEVRDKKSTKPVEWQRADSPYVLKDQARLSVVMVKAVDKSGNTRIAEYVPPAPKGGRVNMILFWAVASLGVIFLAVTRFFRFLPL